MDHRSGSSRPPPSRRLARSSGSRKAQYARDGGQPGNIESTAPPSWRGNTGSSSRHDPRSVRQTPTVVGQLQVTRGANKHRLGPPNMFAACRPNVGAQGAVRRTTPTGGCVRANAEDSARLSLMCDALHQAEISRLGVLLASEAHRLNTMSPAVSQLDRTHRDQGTTWWATGAAGQPTVARRKYCR